MMTFHSSALLLHYHLNKYLAEHFWFFSKAYIYFNSVPLSVSYQFVSRCSCPLFQRIKYGQLCTMICKCRLLWEATAQRSYLCYSSTTMQQWTRFLPLPVVLNTVSSLSPILARCPGFWIHQVGWESIKCSAKELCLNNLTGIAVR